MCVYAWSLVKFFKRFNLGPSRAPERIMLKKWTSLAKHGWWSGTWFWLLSFNNLSRKRIYYIWSIMFGIIRNDFIKTLVHNLEDFMIANQYLLSHIWLRSQGIRHFLSSKPGRAIKKFVRNGSIYNQNGLPGKNWHVRRFHLQANWRTDLWTGGPSYEDARTLKKMFLIKEILPHLFLIIAWRGSKLTLAKTKYTHFMNLCCPFPVACLPTALLLSQPFSPLSMWHHESVPLLSTTLLSRSFSRSSCTPLAFLSSCYFKRW